MLKGRACSFHLRFASRLRLRHSDLTWDHWRWMSMEFVSPAATSRRYDSRITSRVTSSHVIEASRLGRVAILAVAVASGSPGMIINDVRGWQRRSSYFQIEHITCPLCSRLGAVCGVACIHRAGSTLLSTTRSSAKRVKERTNAESDHSKMDQTRSMARQT